MTAIGRFGAWLEVCPVFLLAPIFLKIRHRREEAIVF